MNLFFKNSTALLGATLLFSVTSCVTNHQSVANTQLITGLTATTERTTLEGKWNYTMSNPEQEPFSGVLMVQRGGTVGYTGWISISTIDYEAHTKVIKAEIQGQNFTYTGEVQTRQGSYPFELTGTIKGNKMEGQNKVKTEDGPVIFKVIATRK